MGELWPFAAAGFAGGVVGAAVALLAALGGRRRSEARFTGALRAVHEDLRALCTGAVGLDRRIADLEKRLRRLSERQDRVELRSVSERPYQQAIRLVHKGAGVDELVSTCGLSHGEAELVVLLHKEKKEDGAGLKVSTG